MPKSSTTAAKAVDELEPYRYIPEYRLKVLRLPHADQGPDWIIRQSGHPKPFSATTLCAAIQNNCTIATIKWYIDSYTGSRQFRDGFQKALGRNSWKPLYYSVERNSPELVSIFIQHGLLPKGLPLAFSIPVIAFAIIHGHWEAIDTTPVLREFLTAGVDPTVIPMDMWEEFLEAPREVLPAKHKAKSVALSLGIFDCEWCNEDIRPRLAKALHLTHRYLLHVAHIFKKPSVRFLQIAEAHGMSELMKLPYFLVGQRPASTLVMNSVYSHIAMAREDPLVMAFAGLSGHGKTELARAMGKLLSVKITVIDCASTSTAWGLFGTTAGYANVENGSKLNNFLTENSGKRSVVFLDEFDKTGSEVRNSLLLITEKGDYADRRTNLPVDCSKTIWVVATNLGDSTISSYHAKHLEELTPEKLDSANLKPLQADLKRLYLNRFGAPFTGRINLIVPFLPFSKTERAVMVHKYFLQMANDIRKPIDLSSTPKNLIRHCKLTIIDDGAVCTEISEQFYNQDFGARSLANAVRDVQNMLSLEYSSVDELVTEETNKGSLQEYYVRRVPLDKDTYEIGVFGATAGMDAEVEGNGAEEDETVDGGAESDTTIYQGSVRLGEDGSPSMLDRRSTWID